MTSFDATAARINAIDYSISESDLRIPATGRARPDLRRRGGSSTWRRSAASPGVGAQFEDRKSLNGRVVRPAVGGDAFHPRVIDSDFFMEERDFTLQAVVFGLNPDPGVDVVLRVSPRRGQCLGRGVRADRSMRSLQVDPCLRVIPDNGIFLSWPFDRLPTKPPRDSSSRRAWLLVWGGHPFEGSSRGSSTCFTTRSGCPT